MAYLTLIELNRIEIGKINIYHKNKGGLLMHISISQRMATTNLLRKKLNTNSWFKNCLLIKNQ